MDMHFVDLHKICRICLKTDILVSIFSPGFIVAPIEMIEKLNIFAYNSKENFPSSLCQSCIYRLLDAYNLQQLSESSEARLRDYINTSSVNHYMKLPALEAEINNIGTTASIPLNTPTNNTKDDIYEICDIFEPSNSNDIEVEDDVLNDVEIDVSNLTRSEADETIQDIIDVKTHQVFELETKVMDNTPKSLALTLPKPAINSIKQSEKCDECGKTFSYSGYLEAHKRIHSGERPFQCDICQRCFSQSSNLTHHIRTHTGSRPFQCEVCSKLFTTSSNLTAHKRTHSERREFSCSTCLKDFKTNRELLNHLPLHNATKENICKLCDKAFSKFSYLSVHMKTVHNKIRKHNCDQCDKSFSTKSNLDCHYRIHTGEKPFNCNVCGTKFNQSSALVRHSKQHLKNKVENHNSRIEGNQLPQTKNLISHNYLSNPPSDLNVSVSLGDSSTILDFSKHQAYEFN